ncbi:23S rRNA (guanosine(2251)-2'-O)-methyltransferase RlmB [Treponema sp. C6A8]|uniref:23S rRNA (guanosine(2251)-2'-O)-methyltransferase RlmB n=1 Tax=Treponema sp. C6A8 TaxID=1410609 RepID=UPI000486F92A|nr:23S rRNA (guanosine(2251)-2'-O)-methyltransferase RlmB [Treponema sp. C6A8]
MILTGFHSIEEKLRSLKEGTASGYKLYYSKPGPRVKKIIAAAKEAGITTEQTDDKKLDQMVSSLSQALRDHRGVLLEIEGEEKKSVNIVDFDAWLKTGAKGEKATVVVLDRVTDPHNVGAIIRSCDQFGADLVVLPEHKAASNIEENEVIARTSAGSSAWVPLAIVNNLVRAVEQLKDAGFWVYGADAGGETCGKVDFAQKSVIVMGSEGTGIAQLLEKQCDTIVSIPTCGKIDSLNVSVAAGVLLFERFRRLQLEK